MARTETGYAPVMGGELYFEIAGQGPPVVLIHAGVSTHEMWDEQWGLFTQRYRVVKYDTRGFGRSRTAAVEFSNRQDVRDVMNHVGMPSATLIGVSRGGAISIDFALEFPSMVDALIPVSSGVSGDWGDFQPPNDEKALFAEMEKAEDTGDWDAVVELDLRMWLAGPRRKKEDIDPHLWARAAAINRINYGRTDPEPTAMVLEPPAIGRLHEIKKPTLVVVGECDTTGTLFASEIISKGIPGARRVVMPDTAHLPPMEKPFGFNRIVLDFLSGIL